MATKRGLVIDGIIGSEAIDSSGEVLDVEGCDISTMETDGVLNFEHKADSDNGASFNDIIGKCIKCKKIFTAKDCDNDRERFYWEKSGVPFIYAQFRLFDESGHPGAVAAASIIRDQYAAGESLILRFSLEGSTLEREGNRLKRTICRRCALTQKPCNKAAVSGVLHDPKAPAGEKEKVNEDPLAAFLGDDARKFEHPGYQRLGGADNEYVPFDLTVAALQESVRKLQDVRKALEAGFPAGAPGTLTGGAALQVSELSTRSRVKAALRDYDSEKHGPFAKYLKAEVPEVSDEFAQRFEDLVGDWSIKKKLDFLAKDENAAPAPVGIPDPEDQPEKVKKPFKERLKDHNARVKSIKEEHATAFLPEQTKDMRQLPPSETPEFKLHRRKVGQGGTYFDEGKGVLYTPEKAFKLYVPSPTDQTYHDILKSEHINRIHDEAVRNWMTLHKLVKAGRLPDEVIAQAALFSAMSPRTSVPLQELAFGFWQDFQDPNHPAGGFDPTKRMEPEKYDAYKREWDSIVMSGSRLPEFERDHFMHPGVRAQTQTPEGRRHIITLGSGKWDAATEYHRLHGAIKGLAEQHGADGRAIAGRLMDMKAEYGRFKSRLATHDRNVREGEFVPQDGTFFATRRAKGGTTKQVERPQPQPPETPAVAGFANKTIRYMLGMAGYGNVMVPDTHFIRHTFGFMPEDPHNDIVKKYLTDEKYEASVNQPIDRFYANHHPAVAATRRKIQEQYGEDIGEHATFPGFWLHWLTVGEHDRRRNWDTSQVQNEGTDHRVYWNAVKRVLDKYGIPWEDHRLRKGEHAEEPSMAARVAHAMLELEAQFGTTPAQFAYYATMVPALLQQSHDPVAKALKLTEDLKKAAKQPAKKAEKQQRHFFQGAEVEPGEATVLGLGNFGEVRVPVLKQAAPGESHHVILHDGKPMRFLASNTRILKQPKRLSGGAIVNARKHALLGVTSLPEQHELIQGIDLAQKEFQKLPGQESGLTSRRAEDQTGWHRSAAGHLGYVKPSKTLYPLLNQYGLGDVMFTTAHREAAYYNLAKNYFGMGDHVPVTAAFRHPVTGEPHSVSRQVMGAEHYESKHHADTLRFLGRAGVLDKLALMNNIMHSGDRHFGNFMVTKEAPFIHLIDNGLSMTPNQARIDTPAYWRAFHQLEGKTVSTGGYTLHPEAVNWLKGLDPSKLEAEMQDLRVPPAIRKESVRRLRTMQKLVAKGQTHKGTVFYGPFGPEAE